MRGAAGNDKRSEHEEHPMEGQILPFAHKIDQDDRQDIVGQGDQRIRHAMQPDQLWHPEIAMPVRHEWT
jgi:hypothetical protein